MKLVFSFMLFLMTTSTFAYADFEKPVDLRPYLNPVRDQGYRNTCSAFSAVTLAEFLIYKNTGRKIQLSENFTYWAGKTVALNTPFLQSAYLNVDGLAGYLAVSGMQSGVMLQSQWPYENKNGVQNKKNGCLTSHGVVPTACFTGSPPKGAKVLPYRFEPVFIEREQIAQELMENQRPVAMNISWYYNSVDAKGNVSLPAAADVLECEANNAKVCGGHVVLLVGYLPAERRFLFRSSWGARWGTDGYGTLPEELITEHCEMCRYLNFPNLDDDNRELIENSSMGVTADLIVDEEE